MINELENMTNEYNLPVCVDSSAQKASGGEGGRDKTVHRGSVGGGTQEGHTEPPRSTWIGKETLAKCLCGDGHKAMRATKESPGMGPPKACVGQKQTAHLLREILEV